MLERFYPNKEIRVIPAGEGIVLRTTWKREEKNLTQGRAKQETFPSVEVAIDRKRNERTWALVKQSLAALIAVGSGHGTGVGIERIKDGDLIGGGIVAGLLGIFAILSVRKALLIEDQRATAGKQIAKLEKYKRS